MSSKCLKAKGNIFRFFVEIEANETEITAQLKQRKITL